ncbi:Crp/Fnr family transcriptional regulator [Solirubrobacter phytolaccae]|uniref:Crp/Fnr family transcriptional regulator n=1 Tax=Solirubrobacter phytolaccae TaxID=1404360 RepID=A0A9X3N7W2_9ACTN|nr:Crp/Fnr family transcriptional regulator [Solirubrobacter phytolaccae]MDA0179306.1 Crp/Fnr family transcriptional regulator [Solirubrobacter phytolaccae]
MTGEHDFLGLLEEDERATLRARAVPRAFKRGAAMLREGEEPTRVLVLTEGRAKAVTFTDDGKEVVLGFMIVIRRLRLADLQRKEFTSANTLGRVARRLVDLSDTHGREEDDGVTITLPLSQEELAGWTGASREAVTKALRQLRDLGWIETGRRSISVKDRDALRRFVR